MKELICPNCKKTFSIDEADYAALLNQVRTNEFEKEVEKRVAEAAENVKLVEQTNAKDILSEKQREIDLLKADLKAAETRLELAIANEKSALQNTINELHQQISSAKAEKELALIKAESEKDREVSRLESERRADRDKYESELSLMEQEVKRLKDFKLKQSTKMIGENLEQYCEMLFNMNRAAAFPNAYFEKDNDARDGSKGDFIFKESDENGNEFLSIMFEMKNEADDTEVKHKNEDFFKKLDRDRNTKNCQYAVLVSMLEADNEMYNQGIVNVSFQSHFPNMYVIRPEFFIPFITILRTEAKKSLQYMQQLEATREMNVDIENFEDNLHTFVGNIQDYYLHGHDKLDEAIKGIDDTIRKLEKIKDSFRLADKNFRLMSGKADEMTIKRLTKGNPTMAAMFEGLKENNK